MAPLAAPFPALLLHVAGSQAQVGHLDRPALAAFLSCATADEGDGDAAAGALIELAGGAKEDSSVRASALAAALALPAREAGSDLARLLYIDLSPLLSAPRGGEAGP